MQQPSNPEVILAQPLRPGRFPGGILLGVSALLLMSGARAPAGEAFTPATVRRIVKEVGAKDHPRLLFTDLKETTGFKNRSKEPWRGFLATIERAVRKRAPICQVYEGPTTGAIVHAGGRAHEGETMFDPSLLGLLYQVTGKRSHLEAGIEELTKLEPRRGKDDRTGESDVLARSLIRYCLLFDWIAKELPVRDRAKIVARLAAYADEVYEEYPRSRNPNRRCVLAASLGVAGLALAGERVSTKSRPADWLTVGTIDLFEQDRYPWPAVLLRDGPRSAVEGTCNRGGATWSTGYRSYWIGLVSKWLRIYRQATGRNPLLDFPIARRVLAEPLWSAMPLRLDPLQTTSRGQTWQYYWILWDLLGNREKDGFRWYSQEDEQAFPLRPRHTYGEVWNGAYWFLWFPRTMGGDPPAWRSFKDPKAEAFVFRGGWDRDSDWLHFKCLSQPTGSHRYMMHHDNMSFELAGRGDYLLCDSSEVKSRMRGYGPAYALGHNTLLIDGKGAVKEVVQEEYFAFVNPARITTQLVSDGFDLVEAETTITHTEIDPLGGVVKKNGVECNAEPVSAPVRWRRCILYPLNEYFVVVDSVASAAEHDYAFAFHLSSFSKVNTKAKEKPGHVLGSLSIGGTPFDWSKGVRTDVLDAEKQFVVLDRLRDREADALWETTNPWGRPAGLRLYSAPRPGLLEVGRIWGFLPVLSGPEKGSGEVDHPFLLLHDRARSVARITVLETFGDRSRTTLETLAAKSGTMVSIRGRGKKDLVGAGPDGVRGSELESDARIVFLRTEGGKVRAVALVDGSFLRYRGDEVVTTSRRVRSLAATFASDALTVVYESESPFKLSLGGAYSGGEIDRNPADTFEVIFGAWSPSPQRLSSSGGSFSCPAGSHTLDAR